MTRRLFYIAMGAAVGILVVQRATRAAQRFTPAGVQQSVAGSLSGLTAAISEFTELVREGMAEREDELRVTLGLDGTHDLVDTVPGLHGRSGAGRPMSTSDTRDVVGGDPPPLPVALRVARPPRRAVRVAHHRRPDAAARQRRHGAVQAVLPRRAAAAGRARDQRAEVRAHPRHRGGRQDHAPRLVLPDGRQLLVRRLLQGRRDRLRVGAAHRLRGVGRLRPARGAALDDRLPRRRRGARAVEALRPRGAHPAPRQGRQLLAHGRPGPRWPVQRDLLRPRLGARPRGRAGRGRGPLPRGLEPRLHAVPAQHRAHEGRLRHRRAAAGAEHRHRHGPRARRDRAAGRRQPLRDRHLPGDPRPRGRAHRRPVRAGPGGRRAAARRRRPRPDRRDDDRRRRARRQRGARLRPAPCPAAHRPLDAAARRAGPDDGRARRGVDRRDGPAVPRARRQRRAHRRGGGRRGAQLPRDAHQGRVGLRHRGAGGPAVAAACCRGRRRSSCTTRTASRST